MSLPIAIQSAVFYFVACTPCAKVRHRHKAKAEAKRERKEKAKLITEQPGLYRHPSPFNTNPYWESEIALGPSLPKKTASKNSSQRGLNSSGKDSEAPSVSECTNVAFDSRTNFGDSSTFVPGSDGGLSDDWNRKRGYQREDEELWGQWSGHRIMDAFSKAKDSTARLFEGRAPDKEVTEQDRRDFYFSPKNPPVNDYHPPVVSSKLPHRDAHRWMLQPPPPAKIMEGKVPVSRNVSSGSRSSGRTNPSEEGNLGRKVQERLVRERLQRGEGTPTEEELIDSLFVTRSDRSLSFNRSRSMSLDGVDESAELAYERRQKARAKSKAAPPGADRDDDEDIPATPTRTTGSRNGHGSTRAAQRPKLETISSTGGSDSSTLQRPSKPQEPNTNKLLVAA